MQCLDLLSRTCNAGLEQLYQCSCNAVLHIFPMEKSSATECLSEYNPFLSKNSKIHPFLSVGATIQTSQPAKLSDKDFGRLETQIRRITISRPEEEIPTGLFCYIQMPFGDLIGGKIVSVIRDQAPVLILEVDTSKVVPFSPSLVQLPDWPRTIQN